MPVASIVDPFLLPKSNYLWNFTQVLKHTLRKQGEESLFVNPLESSFSKDNRVLPMKQKMFFVRKELKFCTGLFYEMFIRDVKLTSSSSLEHQQHSKHTWVITSTEVHSKKGYKFKTETSKRTAPNYFVN